MRYATTVALVSIGIVAGTIALPHIRGMEIDQAPPKTSKETIKSLPYLDWLPVATADIGKRGVTMYDQDRSYRGPNVFNYDRKGYLMDMLGRVLHVWSRPIGKWHHVEIMKSGDLLVVDKDSMLVKLDWESNVKWTSSIRCHHDVAVAGNGDIYTLSWNVLEIPDESATIPIVNDYITILSPGGTVKKNISVFDLFGSEIREIDKEAIRVHLRRRESTGKRIEVEPQTIFDVFHTNTVEIIERPIEGVARKGDVLICIRNLDIIAIIDISAEEVVWRLNRNDLDKPHQPSIVDGNILVFDNGYERGYSRVLELDPRTGQTVWEYTASPKESFFSIIRGGCQRLPNGNTLITDSNRARVFEVTPRGKIVWEFYGSEVRKAGKLKRPIYRMTRLAPDFLASFPMGTE